MKRQKKKLRLLSFLMTLLFLLPTFSLEALAEEANEELSAEPYTVPTGDPLPSEPVSELRFGEESPVSFRFEKVLLTDIVSAFAQMEGVTALCRFRDMTLSFSAENLPLREAWSRLLSLTGLTLRREAGMLLLTDSLVENRIQTEETEYETVLSVRDADKSRLIGMAQQICEGLSFADPDEESDTITIRGNAVELSMAGKLAFMTQRTGLLAETGSGEESADFYTVKLQYTEARTFTETLSSLSLPTGIPDENDGNTLYFYTLPSLYARVLAVKALMDLPGGDAQISYAVPTYLPVSTASAVLSEKAGVTVLKSNETTVWMQGNKEQLTKASLLMRLLDTPETAAKVPFLRILPVKCLSSSDLALLLRRFEITDTALDAKDPATLYLFADEEAWEKAQQLSSVFDREEYIIPVREQALAIEPFSLTYIDLSLAQRLLASLSVPTQLFSLDSENRQLYRVGYASDNLLAARLITAVDQKDSNPFDMYQLYTPENMTPPELYSMLAASGLEVRCYLLEEDADELIVACPQENLETVGNLLRGLDQAQS